jgi:predicted nucleotide-binding protein (sugar kinase/HSP70/actin superfamily)
MQPYERKVTFPYMGNVNSVVIKDFMEDLGLNVVMPPKTTDETIRKGAKYCANMACFPLKITLGNYIEALENGANTLLAYDTQGTCRFRQYNLLHEFLLDSLGYDFEMVTLSKKNLLKDLKRLSGKSKLSILGSLYKHHKRIKKNDSQEWSNDKPNIGIIGEIYCCVEEKANFQLEDKIRKYGGNPFNTATTTQFMEDTIPLFSFLGRNKWFKKDELEPYKKEADKFMDGWRAGHSYQNLYNLLWLSDRGVDGIIHVAPLSCMPETTIEPYVDKICRENKIPILRIPIDENSAEANLETRLETFVELIKIRKDKNEKK